MIKLPEPVAEVYTMEALIKGGGVRHHVVWTEPCPPRGSKLLTADQLKQAIRDALEEAAKVVAETKEWENGKWTSTICPTTTEAIGAAIRKLKEDIQ